MYARLVRRIKRCELLMTTSTRILCQKSLCSRFLASPVHTGLLPRLLFRDHSIWIISFHGNNFMRRVYDNNEKMFYACIYSYFHYLIITKKKKKIIGWNGNYRMLSLKSNSLNIHIYIKHYMGTAIKIAGNIWVLGYWQHFKTRGCFLSFCTRVNHVAESRTERRVFLLSRKNCRRSNVNLLLAHKGEGDKSAPTSTRTYVLRRTRTRV